MATKAEYRSDDGGVAGIDRQIREARARAGMTRRHLAKASGTSERYLAHLEAGVGNPTLSVLESLAGALDVAPVELLPQGGERTPELAACTALLRRLTSEQLQDFQRWVAASSGHGEKGHRIVLIGLRGAGKSSLGADLANRIGVPFFELSKEIELAYGGPIGTLIELLGQPALRRYEREAWERLRNQHDAAVIAAPGGVVADRTLFERMLTTSHTIWLQASPDQHMARVMAQGDFRPMASNRAAMDDLKAILEARSGDYARADRSLDTATRDFGATADALEQLAEGIFRGSAI